MNVRRNIPPHDPDDRAHVDSARGWNSPGCTDLASRRCGRRSSARRIGVSALSKERRHCCPGRVASSVVRRPRVCIGTGGYARMRRLGRVPGGRISPARAIRRARSIVVDCRTSLVHREGGDVRKVLGWIQLPSDCGPRSPGTGGHHHTLLDRRSILRRRSLPGWMRSG